MKIGFVNDTTVSVVEGDSVDLCISLLNISANNFERIFTLNLFTESVSAQGKFEIISLIIE